MLFRSGQVSCTVLIDGEMVETVTASYRSKVSEDEVRFSAAERANAKVKAESVNIDKMVVGSDGEEAEAEIVEAEEETAAPEDIEDIDEDML